MKINGSVDTNNAAADQQDLGLPQWNESAKDHAMALGQATEALSDETSSDDSQDSSQDYPLAMDDLELGDFLMDAMSCISFMSSIMNNLLDVCKLGEGKMVGVGIGWGKRHR